MKVKVEKESIMKKYERLRSLLNLSIFAPKNRILKAVCSKIIGIQPKDCNMNKRFKELKNVMNLSSNTRNAVVLDMAFCRIMEMKHEEADPYANSIIKPVRSVIKNDVFMGTEEDLMTQVLEWDWIHWEDEWNLWLWEMGVM